MRNSCRTTSGIWILKVLEGVRRVPGVFLMLSVRGSRGLSRPILGVVLNTLKWCEPGRRICFLHCTLALLSWRHAAGAHPYTESDPERRTSAGTNWLLWCCCTDLCDRSWCNRLDASSIGEACGPQRDGVDVSGGGSSGGTRKGGWGSRGR